LSLIIIKDLKRMKKKQETKRHQKKEEGKGDRKRRSVT